MAAAVTTRTLKLSRRPAPLVRHAICPSLRRVQLTLVLRFWPYFSPRGFSGSYRCAGCHRTRMASVWDRAERSVAACCVPNPPADKGCSPSGAAADDCYDIDKRQTRWDVARSVCVATPHAGFKQNFRVARHVEES